MRTYWENNAELRHITPPGAPMPEVGLFEALQRACLGSVFEFGCGYGRLAPAFRPDKYHGFDINPAALDEARKRNPGHTFGDTWAPADTFLAYTVLLHVHDDEIADTLRRAATYKRVVIGEIMGRKWRRPGDPPVYNRETGEYAALMRCDPVEVIKVPYPRYKCDLDLLVFEP